MPPKSKPLGELGSVEVAEGTFRAHVQYRDAASRHIDIRGPKRTWRPRAEVDLEQIRAAGAVGRNREEGLAIMAAEARRIQLSAQLQAEAEMQRQRAAREREAPIEFLSDDEPDDEPWLMDYPSPREKEDAPTAVSQKAPLTKEEADEELRKFRPIRSCPAELEHLLACRADPNGNKPLADGDISPLRNVLTFADGHHVEKMRELLLEYGAEETEEERERWRICERAWLYENIRLREARIDERDYDPCGAAMERNM